jgi:hypothetical protein
MNKDCRIASKKKTACRAQNEHPGSAWRPDAVFGLVSALHYMFAPPHNPGLLIMPSLNLW